MTANIVSIDTKLKDRVARFGGSTWGNGVLCPTPGCGAPLMDSRPGNILTGFRGEPARIACHCPKCRWIGFRTLPR